MEIDSKSLDPPAVHLAHGKNRSASDHAVAHHRQPAQHSENVPADSRVVLVGDSKTEVFVQLADVGAARHQSLAGSGVQRGLRVFRRVVLVEDLTDDFLEQIFHRDDAGGSTVLVEHDRHVLLQPLEVGENLLDFARAGYDVHGPHDRRQVESFDVGARGEQLQQVLGEHDSDNVVDGLVVNRITRQARFLNDAEHFGERGFDGQRDELRARGHHFARVLFGKLEYCVDEIGVVRLHLTALLRLLDQ